MGVMDMIRGRNDTHIAHNAFESAPAEKETDVNVASDSDTLSLEARNEKEAELHPDQVTKNAQAGVQKAEATAIVWSKKAVIATYAW